MLMRTWDPVTDLITMRNQINRVFENFLRRSETREGEDVEWCPTADVYETANEFRIVLEVPGLGKDDFKLSFNDGSLTIRGERKRREGKEESYFLAERPYGKFQRTFALPGNVDPTKIRASYKDGLLVVTIPKKEEAKPKEIPISVE